jgi:hypothetical protein
VAGVPPTFVVTARRYEPGFIEFGRFATIVPVPELKLCTVSGTLWRVTLGVVVPKLVPTIVILFNP